MFAFKASVVLALVALVAAQKDQETLENVVKCVQSKMPNGIPEINFPSFNPWLQPFNMTFGAEFVIFKYFFVVDNVKFYDIPKGVVKITQTSGDSDKVATFDWSVTFEHIFIDAFWDKYLNLNGTDQHQHGLMNMTLTNTVFKGNLAIEKPLLTGKITKFEITSNSVDDAVVGVSNMGEFEDFIFSKLFRYVWKFIISSSLFGEVMEKTLGNIFVSWLENQDKLKVLLSGCKI